MANGIRTETTVSHLTPPSKRRRIEDCDHVIIRELPKAVFLYPTLLASVVIGLCAIRWPEHDVTLALIFHAVLFLNLFVLALDFPRTSALTLLIGGVALLLAAILLDQRYDGFLPAVQTFSERLTPSVNDQFYFTIAGILVVIYLLIFIFDVRLDYWEVMPNEIIHHHGMWDSKQRYPAPGLVMQKDITDVFELLLLRSGRLTIHPTDGPDIILENVPNINRVERQIQTMLEALSVEITDPSRHRHATADR